MRLTALALLLAAAAPAAAEVAFLHPLDDAPLPLDLRPEQALTEAAATFQETGENPYSGDAGAIAAGEASYGRLCQSCHLPDGTGRIGPNLTDADWLYERADTDVGRFEVIYAGAAGSMQAFGQRIDQDEILQIMAYIDTFRAEG